MAFAAVAHLNAGSTDGNGFTSGSIDTSGATVIFVVLASASGAARPTLTDSKSNPWTQIGTEATNGTAGSRVTTFYSNRPSVGAGHTFTIAGNGTSPSISVGAFSGGPALLDQQNSNSSASASSLTTGSVTPGSANQIVIAGCVTNGATNITAIDSSFTLYDTFNVVSGAYGSAIAYQIQTTATTRNPSFTLAGACAPLANIATFSIQADPPPRGPDLPRPVLAKTPNYALGFTAAASLSLYYPPQPPSISTYGKPWPKPIYPKSGHATSGGFIKQTDPWAVPDFSSALIYITVNGIARAYGRDAANGSIAVGSLFIEDVLNQTPNTCRFVARGFTPTVGMRVVMALGGIDNPSRLFAGSILSVTPSYVGTPANQEFSVSCIDDTWLLNKVKVIKTYTSQSATDIAIDLLRTYAPGFTFRHVQPGLDTIDIITFTNEDLTTCFNRLAKRAGVDWKTDDFDDLWFGTTGDGVSPVALTATHPTLSEFASSTTISDIITRCLVEGGGVSALAAVAAVTSSIAFDAVSSAATGGAASLTWTHTCAGLNGMLVVSTFTVGDLVTGVTYGGLPLTLVDKKLQNTVYTYMFTLAAPTLGANSIVISLSGSSAFAGAATSYTGVKQTTVEASATGSSASSTAFGTSVTTVTANAFVVLAAVCDNGTATGVTGGTLRANSGTLLMADNGPVATPASTTITGTCASLSNWGTVIASFAPVTAETMLPVESTAAWYNAAGGTVVVGTQRLTYTGIQAGGPGSLVGPGVGPSSAPALALAGGVGIETGAHGYAVVYRTTNDTTLSLPSPGASITVGLEAVPTTAPTPGSPTSGGSVDAGNHRYAITFVNAAGETTEGPRSILVTTTRVVEPLVAPSNSLTNGTYSPGWSVGDEIHYVVTFITPLGETIASPVSASTLGTDVSPPSPPYLQANTISLPVSSDSSVTGRRFYRYVNGVCQGYLLVNNNATTTYVDYGSGGLTAGSPPGSSTAGTWQTVPLTGIPLGGGSVTSRRIYRASDATGTLKLVATIADNVTTTYVDTTANASLGVTVPAANTATANRVSVSNIPIGGSAVTRRWLYRTVAGGSTYKLLAVITDNTTTTYADSTADASLGATAPSSDTSGLTQPNGQVLAGQATLLSAGVGWASSTGGWAVIGNGQQVIRYTGYSGNTLSGIPASGHGAITATISYNSTITAAPCLTGIPSTGTGSILYNINKGDPVNLLVQVDDTAAQAVLSALLDPSNLLGGAAGIREDYLQDNRISETEARARGTVQLALMSQAQVSVTYRVRDPLTASGRTITIDLPSPQNLSTDLTIQRVTISNFKAAATFFPDYAVEASSVRMSFDDLVRMFRAQLDG